MPEPERRRGHGGVYDALNCGEVRIGRLRAALASLPLRGWPDGRIRLACDASNWLRLAGVIDVLMGRLARRHVDMELEGFRSASNTTAPPASSAG